MAAHALLKNEFTEDEKYHNLKSWLNYLFSKSLIEEEKSNMQDMPMPLLIL